MCSISASSNNSPPACGKGRRRDHPEREPSESVMRTIPTLAALLALTTASMLAAQDAPKAPSSRKQPLPHHPPQIARAAHPSPRRPIVTTTSSGRMTGSPTASTAARSKPPSRHRVRASTFGARMCAGPIWTANSAPGTSMIIRAKASTSTTSAEPPRARAGHLVRQ